MKKMKRLLFLVSRLLPHTGGAERHVISLLNHLDIDDFSMSLICLKEEEELLSQSDFAHMDNIAIFRVKHKIDFSVVSQLARYIEEQRVDIVVCTNQYPMLYGLLARRKTSYPFKVVEVFHTTLPKGLSDKLQWLFYKHFFRRCDHIVFVSENQSKYWLEGRGMVTRSHSVIQNGIETEKFNKYEILPSIQQDLLTQYGIQAHKLMIGICAGLRPEKKHTDLIQAISQLRNQGVDAGLLIIGDGDERQRLEGYVATSPSLEQSVYFVGFQQDVRPFVKLCHCMVIASHSIETFSISALESMALGKPMIMTDIGGASEQITHGQNGFLYPAGDIDSLVKYLKELVAPLRRENMGEIARRTVDEKFTLAKMVNKFEMLLTGDL